MKCQILFSGKKNKKNLINSSSAESAHRMVCVKQVFEIHRLNSTKTLRKWTGITLPRAMVRVFAVCI